MKKKKPRKKVWQVQYTEKLIPVPYARLVQQFILEIRHGRENNAHEALRRMAYAERMLDEFGYELEGYKGAKENFRSKVLTPVLQRQLRGMPDNYARPLCDFMSSTDEGVTIADATAFYLSVDPIDPDCIPSYRRNLVYIREARWHIMSLEGIIDPGSAEAFAWTLENQANVMQALQEELLDDERNSQGEDDDSQVPKLRYSEVMLIIAEGLKKYFEHELARVVCTKYPPHSYANPHCC